MLKLTLNEKLETPHLMLRVPQPEDSEAYFEVLERNRTDLRIWLPWVDKVTTVAHAIDFITDTRQKFIESKKAEYFIYEKESGDFCGVCSAVIYSGDKNYISIGYWLDTQKRGKGYIIETITAIESDLFPQGLNRMVINVDVENAESNNVPKRLGYKMEGVNRKIHYSPYTKTYRDFYMWSKIDEEFKNG